MGWGGGGGGGGCIGEGKWDESQFSTNVDRADSDQSLVMFLCAQDDKMRLRRRCAWRFYITMGRRPS